MDLRLVLLELSGMLGSADAVLTIPSSNLASALAVSQQTASRYMARLEKTGLIKRVIRKRGQDVSLTAEGVSVLEGMHSQLEFFLKSKKAIQMDGLVSIGLGEGAYYVRMYADRIRKVLGFRPFYGTLNVAVEEMPANLGRFAFKSIGNFEREGRSFGGIKIAKILLAYGRRSRDCFLILPERTHHKRELELISPVNLRSVLGLRDGSRVKITLLQSP